MKFGDNPRVERVRQFEDRVYKVETILSSILGSEFCHLCLCSATLPYNFPAQLVNLTYVAGRGVFFDRFSSIPLTPFPSSC